MYNAPIMIFDEATASVDVKTESNIQRAINGLNGNKTMIIIAHRLSTIRNADKIIVLDKGEIVEEGNHEELLNKGGKYAKMCKIQEENAKVSEE